MEPPCEHGGVGDARQPIRRAAIRASMEPPCEHGGVVRRLGFLRADVRASMEPPCEHGGVRRSTERRSTKEPRFNGAAV